MKKFYLLRLFGLIATTILVACGGGGGGSPNVPNAVPVANAGADQSVLENSGVTLDGLTSSDPENSPLTYTWSQVSGSTVALSSTTTASPQFTAPDVVADETLVFELVVNDGNSNSVADSVNVNVMDQPAVSSLRLPETGQQGCFDALGAAISCTATGQDGDIRAGVAWPNPRFTDLGDGTLLDELTGLVWLADGNIMPVRDSGFDTEGTPDDGIVSWQTALDYVEKLNTESHLGFQDWRLPNRNELMSLAHLNDANSTASFQAAGFTNYLFYWSSTTQTTAGQFAWTLNLVNGFWSISAKTATGFGARNVLPVRAGNDNAASAVAATGQTDCFDNVGIVIACSGTGQDGELQTGVSMPNLRFVTNTDSSITDQMTGLIWESDPNVMLSRDPGYDPTPLIVGAVTWQLALDYIDKLNVENHLGHSDWRLPNTLELLSLFNNGVPSNSAWLSASGFDALPFAHWSSTTNLGSGTDLAWGVQLSSGLSAVEFKTSDNSFSVWPVRGGN